MLVWQVPSWPISAFSSSAVAAEVLPWIFNEKSACDRERLNLTGLGDCPGAAPLKKILGDFWLLTLWIVFLDFAVDICSVFSVLMQGRVLLTDYLVKVGVSCWPVSTFLVSFTYDIFLLPPISSLDSLLVYATDLYGTGLTSQNNSASLLKSLMVRLFEPQKGCDFPELFAFLPGLF